MRVTSLISAVAICSTFAPAHVASQTGRLRLSPATIIDDGSSGVLPSSRFTARVLVTPKNDVIIVRLMEPEVFIFRSDGSKPQRLFREGSGPGEFRRPNAAGFLRDTLWIGDSGLRRITYFARYGGGAPVTAPFAGRVDGAFTVGLPMTISPLGSAICIAVTDASLLSAGAVRHAPVLRSSRDGHETRDTLAFLDVFNSLHRIQRSIGSGDVIRDQTFSDKSLLAASPNGEFVGIVVQSDASRTPRRQKRVILRRIDGPEVFSIPIPLRSGILAPRELEVLIDSKLATLNLIADRIRVPRIGRGDFAQSLFRPTEWVPVSDVIVGDDGAVLLRGNDWADGPVEHVVIRSSGTGLESFVVASNQSIKAIRGNLVWSLRELEDGELQLIRQTLLR